ncbi:uncharacterized protein LOC101846055 [Aplysia californica]|uniref:Uncharacterized protein LOC101846055 n=1 Tax=Aplysia californica TaxID=6500 RepID=A0ABM1AFN4_APLCA|nr:uncharacterized protein LOC101846055 [Aplysia californica]
MSENREEFGSLHYARELSALLPQCLRDLTEVSAADQVEYVGRWLHRAADARLHRQAKQQFLDQSQTIARQMEMVRQERDRHLAGLRDRMDRLKGFFGQGQAKKREREPPSLSELMEKFRQRRMQVYSEEVKQLIAHGAVKKQGIKIVPNPKNKELLDDLSNFHEEEDYWEWGEGEEWEEGEDGVRHYTRKRKLMRRRGKNGSIRSGSQFRGQSRGKSGRARRAGERKHEMTGDTNLDHVHSRGKEGTAGTDDEAGEGTSTTNEQDPNDDLSPSGRSKGRRKNRMRGHFTGGRGEGEDWMYGQEEEGGDFEHLQGLSKEKYGYLKSKEVEFTEKEENQIISMRTAARLATLFYEFRKAKERLEDVYQLTKDATKTGAVLQGNRVSFSHPVLGQLGGKAQDEAEELEEAAGFPCEAVYDSELYTVCEPDADPIDYEARGIVQMTYEDFHFEEERKNRAPAHEYY